MYVLSAIGSPVDSKYIDMEPIHLCMTPDYVIAANQQVVYVWQYHYGQGKDGQSGERVREAER